MTSTLLYQVSGTASKQTNELTTVKTHTDIKT